MSINKIGYFLFSFLLFGFSLNLHAQVYFQDQATALGVGDSGGTIYLGGGISFCDFNNDGWDDITIATQSGDPLKIYKNNGDGTFSLESTLNPNNNSNQKQVVWVDFDNDGDKDLYITSDVSGNKLYRNDGTTFTDITSTSGLPTVNLFTYGASWGDYDNDGHLDVFISNRDINLATPNYLYKNNGNGTFTDVSITSGIGTGSHLSFCAAFFDYNNDGWQDIYIANDKVSQENLLYSNNGDGTFTEIGQSSGTNVAIDAMSTTIGDYNNDGWFDIYVTNGPPGNVLFTNNGNGTFTNDAFESGTIFNSVGWGSVFLDAENDGDLDLYVSGAMDGSIPSLISAAFYENNNNGAFTLSNTSVGFVGDTRVSYGNAIGDTDNDGFPEIIVNNDGGDNIFLWKNQTTSTNNWLKVDLEGTTSNKQGVGSRIEISAGGQIQYRYTLCGEGYLGQNSDTEFFGIGANTNIDYVKITWLSGMQDILYNVTSNQKINIIEGSNPLSTEEFQVKNEIRVYPNPTTGKIWINFDTNEDYKYILFDSKGIRVKNGQITEQKYINIADLSSGYYLLKILGKTAVYTKKIMLK
ncbi:VCBS repeat-containing protein [Kordia sp. YSTF-M3]|uniref:VCBS repeat-containing protein n=1 Tax=Kordia aestuariivivens TaxID=2759037 RepID=A0ABR7QC74_9FLAO|nr:FG-GAP-like repeat-containing protein [Kordia aestuariivivens]MBC8756175.1 VCBS repeat-containing protein [Kordia aestuariivivens]